MATIEASTGNVFNMGNLLIYTTKERDKQIVFGAYNGGLEITLSEGFKKGVAPKKVKVNPSQLLLIEKTLSKLINNPGPNMSCPLKFTRMKKDSEGKWTKPFVYFILQFSTDDKSIVHIGAKHIEEDDTQISCLIPIRTNGVESDLIIDQAASSLNAAEGLLKWMDRVWSVSSLFTRNNLYIPNKSGNKSSSNELLNFNSSSEDIAF